MRAIVIATVTIFLGACATPPETQAPAPAEERKPGAAQPVEAKPIARVDVTGKPTASSVLRDPNNILSRRTIYFDFDKFDVKDEYRPLMQAHAKYLRDNPGAKMLIQGNADERGSREYNVGLGQRRSEAVKKMLMLLGVTEAQIESVSLGEEKPVCNEHSEDCWAKNRRGEILYGGEY